MNSLFAAEERAAKRDALGNPFTSLVLIFNKNWGIRRDIVQRVFGPRSTAGSRSTSIAPSWKCD